MKVRVFFVLWLVLTAVGFPRPVCGRTEYLAVFMDGKKVGHAIQSRVAADGKVTTTEKVSIQVSRADFPMTINMTETCIETTGGEPLGFMAVQELSMMVMKVVGRVNSNGTVDITTTSMGTEQKSTMEWPSGAVMAEGLRLLTLKKGLKEGLSYTANVFSPGLMQAVDAEIRVGPKLKKWCKHRLARHKRMRDCIFGCAGAGLTPMF